MIYLDANASERLLPEAERAMVAAARLPGNPSSVHGAGRAARRVLEDARERIARWLGGAPENLVFTSGATEAIALAVRGLGQGRRVLAGGTEHEAVRAAAPDAETIPVDADGRADLAALARMLDGAPALVCLLMANNETGVVQDITAAGSLCQGRGALLFVDAVQAAGRLSVDLAATGAAGLAVSSHKLGGPLGAGALLLADDSSAIAPLIAGGGQERGRRGGAPPLPAIAGFAAAVTALAGRPAPCLAKLRDAAELAAVEAGAVVLGGGAARLDNTTCVALPGVRAETQVIALDLAGIAVSAGAACSSGKVARSHVLAAMGAGALAGEAIRVSLPRDATAADVAAFARAYAEMAARLRARRAA